MNNYELKKVIEIDNNLSIEECINILEEKDECLGILDNNRDIVSYVIKDDIEKVKHFNIQKLPIETIATLANVEDLDINNLKEINLNKYINNGLNKGVFIGKNKKRITHLLLNRNSKIELKKRNLAEKYTQNISLNHKKAIEYCSTAADKINLPIYIVGGVVRDLILGQSSFDIDITVEENAIEFCKFLKREYPDICTVKETHENFKTAKIIFNIKGKEIELDIASTRKETYATPASLPIVEQIGCNIYNDLVRRDFSINAMAISLNKKTFGDLTDPFNGYNDLQSKKIKVLHPISFIDDPTRIIRALKFAIRFNCFLDDATLHLQKKCLESDIFNNLAGERIKSELRQTFNLNNAQCFSKFIKDKISPLVSTKLAIPQNYFILSKKIQDIIDKYKKYLESENLIWLVYFGVLIIDMPEDKITELCSRLNLSGLETQILLRSQSLINKIYDLETTETNFETYEVLEGCFVESILISLIVIEQKTKNYTTILNKVDLYLKKLQFSVIHISGKDLVNIGFKPGPIFGEILRELLKAKINNQIFTKENEIEFVKKFLSKK